MAAQKLTNRATVWLLLTLLTLCSATALADSIKYVDIVENVWEEFTCQYDPSQDSGSAREFALFLLDTCSDPVPSAIPVEVGDLKAAVLWLGVITGGNPSYKGKFGQSGDGPFLNDQHRAAAEALRLLTTGAADGASGAKRISVSVGPSGNGKCLVCAQSLKSYSYSETRRAQIRKITGPSVWLSENGNVLTPNKAHLVRQNDSVIISCSVTGAGRVTARLIKDGVVIRETLDEARQDLARAQLSDSGLYRCEGTSDLELLRQRNLHFASTNASLLVKFAPSFEVDEIVRYTPVGQEESIQVKIRAYPEPELTCLSEPPEAASDSGAPKRLVSYDLVSYYAQYRLVYSNLDRLRNVTRIYCTASNELGQSRLEIVLTARAPQPLIISDGRTSWWNSYHLTWQHHVNASIDSYRIQIVYLQQNGSALNTTKASFTPGAKLGHVAMVSSEDNRVAGQRLHNGVVFNLLPEAAHDISLQSCNRHGCSEFSPPIRVRTAAQSAKTFNDPDNPKYRDLSNLAPVGLAGASWSFPLALILHSLLRRLTEDWP